LALAVGLSAAKGYLVVKNKSWLTTDVAVAPSPAEDEFREKEEKFNFILNEVRREKEEALVKMIEERRQVETVLRESNVALARENEQLKAEKRQKTKKGKKARSPRAAELSRWRKK